MKATHLFFPLLVATTVWAEPSSWAFFAEIKNTLIPLYDESYGDYSVLVYDMPMVSHIDFFYKDKYAVANGRDNGPGYVGFYKETLAFGPNVPKTQMQLDSSMRVQNHLFYSCPQPDNAPGRMITYKNIHPSCFQVSVYLLPYLRTSEFAMKAVPMPVEQSKDAIFADVPNAIAV